MVAAIDRQAPTPPVSRPRDATSVPSPTTGVRRSHPRLQGVIEETHVFSPNIVNQFKYGFARHNGPTYQPNQTPAYAASTQGITGLPAGQAAGAFPIVNFSSSCSTLTSNAPTCWTGQVANVTIAQNFTLLDNAVEVIGKHSFNLRRTDSVAAISGGAGHRRLQPAYDRQCRHRDSCAQ